MVASRYVKSSDWDSATDILYGGALALLKAGQGGSGGDLGCFLVDVLGKAEKGCGAAEKGASYFLLWGQTSEDVETGEYKVTRTLISTTGKLLALLRAFPPNEPTKKRFVSEMIAWSGKAGEYPNGDPELHHVAGTLFAEGIQSLHEFLHTFWVYSNVLSLQRANRTTRSVISPLVPKTPLSSLLKLSTNGTLRMNPTPPLSMLQEPSFLTF